jgi:hypothetical protein
MSVLNERRKPNCDVCEWATSSWWAYEMNLCQSDFEMVCKVAKQERENIIKLLGEYPCESMPGHPVTCECESRQAAIALIKGKNK